MTVSSTPEQLFLDNLDRWRYGQRLGGPPLSEETRMTRLSEALELFVMVGTPFVPSPPGNGSGPPAPPGPLTLDNLSGYLYFVRDNLAIGYWDPETRQLFLQVKNPQDWGAMDLRLGWTGYLYNGQPYPNSAEMQWLVALFIAGYPRMKLARQIVQTGPNRQSILTFALKRVLVEAGEQLPYLEMGREVDVALDRALSYLPKVKY